MNLFDVDFALNSRTCWYLTLTLLHVSWIGLAIGFIAEVGNRVSQNRTRSTFKLLR